ncbi:MAG: glycosyltransferase family 4 protein [Actinomycetota bacterium]|nr:glycosyltransferase family 4 protein [Actinomycetota bacterium]
MAGTDILQVITDTDRRGAQVFAVDLHDALAGRGHDLRTVALSSGRHGDLLDLPVLGASWRTWEAMSALRHEMARARVVVAHGSSTLPACAIAGVGGVAPFVYRQIADSLFWASTPARRLRVRLFLRQARSVVALWTGAARVLSERFGLDERRIEIIPNGVPASRCPVVDPGDRPVARARFGLHPHSPTLLYIGALVPEKGADAAIRALAGCEECQLLVVGAGPEYGALRALAGAVAPARVVFAGPVDHPANAFAAADIVVLPSRGGDSMPGVLIEAGLSGLPAVATSVGGIPAIVRAEVTGEIVAPDDEVQLVAAIRRALHRADRYGRAARQHCLEHFEIDAVAAQWDRLLTSMLEGAAADG